MSFLCYNLYGGEDMLEILKAYAQFNNVPIILDDSIEFIENYIKKN